MGKTADSFFWNSTSLVSWSITRATLDLSASVSRAACRPAASPYDGFAGTAATTAARLAARLAGRFTTGLATGFVTDFTGGFSLVRLPIAGFPLSFCAAKAWTPTPWPRQATKNVRQSSFLCNLESKKSQGPRRACLGAPKKVSNYKQKTCQIKHLQQKHQAISYKSCTNPGLRPGPPCFAAC